MGVRSVRGGIVAPLAGRRRQVMSVVVAIGLLGAGMVSLAMQGSVAASDDSSFGLLVPARVLETRSGLSTVDGQFNGIGVRAAGSVTELVVGGRAGVPADAVAVSLNVTVTGTQGAGYLTVWPCGEARPNASNLNYVVDETIPNAVISKVGVGGRVCVFTQAATDVLVDVNGYFPAATSTTTTTSTSAATTTTSPSTSSAPSTTSTSTTMPITDPTMVDARVLTDLGLQNRFDSGDVLRLTFSEDMQDALGTSAVFVLLDGDGDTFNLSCAAVVTSTCVLSDDGLAVDRLLTLTVTAAIADTNVAGNGVMNMPASVANKNAAVADQSGTVLDLVASADVVVDKE